MSTNPWKAKLAAAVLALPLVVGAAPLAQASWHEKAAANPCAAQNPCAPKKAENPCAPKGTGKAKAKGKEDTKEKTGGAATNPCAAQNPCAPKGR